MITTSLKHGQFVCNDSLIVLKSRLYPSTSVSKIIKIILHTCGLVTDQRGNGEAAVGKRCLRKEARDLGH